MRKFYCSRRDKAVVIALKSLRDAIHDFDLSFHGANCPVMALQSQFVRAENFEPNSWAIIGQVARVAGKPVLRYGFTEVENLSMVLVGFYASLHLVTLDLRNANTLVVSDIRHRAAIHSFDPLARTENFRVSSLIVDGTGRPWRLRDRPALLSIDALTVSTSVNPYLCTGFASILSREAYAFATLIQSDLRRQSKRHLPDAVKTMVTQALDIVAPMTLESLQCYITMSDDAYGWEPTSLQSLETHYTWVKVMMESLMQLVRLCERIQASLNNLY